METNYSSSDDIKLYVNELQNLFPQFDEEILWSVLASTNLNIEMSVELLLNMNNENHKSNKNYTIDNNSYSNPLSYAMGSGSRNIENGNDTNASNNSLMFPFTNDDCPQKSWVQKVKEVKNNISSSLRKRHKTKYKRISTKDSDDNVFGSYPDDDEDMFHL